MLESPLRPTLLLNLTTHAPCLGRHRSRSCSAASMHESKLLLLEIRRPLCAHHLHQKGNLLGARRRRVGEADNQWAPTTDRDCHNMSAVPTGKLQGSLCL